jgi:hypothetical protein
LLARVVSQRLGFVLKLSRAARPGRPIIDREETQRDKGIESRIYTHQATIRLVIYTKVSIQPFRQSKLQPPIGTRPHCAIPGTWTTATHPGHP